MRNSSICVAGMQVIKIMKTKKTLYFILLQVAIFIMSLGGVCSKLAGIENFLSPKFIMYYGFLLLILFAYAIIWQQVLKEISLSVAYGSKGVGILYVILWGTLIFDEVITWNMILGIVLVLIGVYILTFHELKEKKNE